MITWLQSIPHLVSPSPIPAIMGFILSVSCQKCLTVFLKPRRMPSTQRCLNQLCWRKLQWQCTIFRAQGLKPHQIALRRVVSLAYHWEIPTQSPVFVQSLLCSILILCSSPLQQILPSTIPLLPTLSNRFPPPLALLKYTHWFLRLVGTLTSLPPPPHIHPHAQRLLDTTPHPGTYSWPFVVDTGWPKHIHT